MIEERKTAYWHDCMDFRIGLEHLRHIIESEHMAPPRLRLLKGDRFYDPRRFRGIQDGKLVLQANYNEVVASVNSDSTLVIDNIGPLLPSIQELCIWAESVVQCRCSGNLYSAKEAVGRFGPHSDQHDVLAIQLAGAKQWSLPNDKIEMQDGTTTRSVRLIAGDVLYVPTGTIHDVTAVGELSIHVAVSLS